MLIPFSVVSVALLGAALIVVVIKTILFQRRFNGKTFSQWLYFDNASIYSSGKSKTESGRIYKTGLPGSSRCSQ